MNKETEILEQGMSDMAETVLKFFDEGTLQLSDARRLLDRVRITTGRLGGDEEKVMDPILYQNRCGRCLRRAALLDNRKEDLMNAQGGYGVRFAHGYICKECVHELDLDRQEKK